MSATFYAENCLLNYADKNLKFFYDSKLVLPFSRLEEHRGRDSHNVNMFSEVDQMFVALEKKSPCKVDINTPGIVRNLSIPYQNREY